MAIRSSSRIAAAKARLRAGHAKAIRSSDRIAKMNELSERDRLQKATRGGRVQKSGSRPSRTKKSGATRASRAKGGNEQRFGDANEPASPESASNGPRRYGPRYHGPTMKYWNGNFPPATQSVDEEPGYFDTHNLPDDNASSESGPDPDPRFEMGNEGRFLQIVFNGVTTQRALRRKRDELRKCRQDVRDADSMVKQFQLETTSSIPATDEEWNMHNAALEKVTGWEATLIEQQNLEKRIDLQIEFLQCCAEKWTYHDQDFQRWPLQNHRLGFWSRNNSFWESFDRCQATSETLVNIDHELGQSNGDIGGFNRALDRELKRDLDFTIDDDGSFSSAGEEFAYQDMSRIPDLFQKQRELQQDKHAARKIHTAQ
jgi:hypothetical protein